MAAWEHFYRRGLSGARGTPLGEGILAIKNELHYCGFNSPAMKLALPVFGKAAEENARLCQRHFGLAYDGIVGPETARRLFRKRARAVQAHKSIPNDILCRQKSEESGNDPAAIGVVDPNDTGLVQINLHYRAVTLEQAIDPAFSLPYAGYELARNFASFGDWEAALAAWNVGIVAAKSWLRKGKPAGTPASRYVELVLKAPV